MGTKVILNLGLLPEERFSQELTLYSKELNAVHEGIYVLGENSLPHVTLLQFYCDEDASSQIWQKVSHLARKSVDLNFGGLCLDLWNQWNCIWLKVTRTRELEDLQKGALSNLKEFSFINGLDEEYQPHATLLAFPCLPKIPPFPIKANILNKKGIKGRLTLGVSGPNYQYAKCLHGI